MAPNIFMVVQEDYITIGTEVYRISEMYPKYWPQSVPDAKPPPNVVFVQVHSGLKSEKNCKIFGIHLSKYYYYTYLTANAKDSEVIKKFMDFGSFN